MYLYLPTCLPIYPSIPCILGCSPLPVTVTTWIPVNLHFPLLLGGANIYPSICVYIICICRVMALTQGFCGVLTGRNLCRSAVLWPWFYVALSDFLTLTGLAASLISMVTQANSRERTHWLTSFWRVYQIGSASSRCSTSNKMPQKYLFCSKGFGALPNLYKFTTHCYKMGPYQLYMGLKPHL